MLLALLVAGDGIFRVVLIELPGVDARDAGQPVVCTTLRKAVLPCWLSLDGLVGHLGSRARMQRKEEYQPHRRG